MTETKLVDDTLQRFQFLEPDDDVRAGWVRCSEFVRQQPQWLPWLKETDKPLYRKITAGIRTLAISARYELWRDPREGVGARPQQLIPGTPGSFSDRADWLVWLLMGGRGSGKSRTGAEALRELLLGRKWRDKVVRVALVGQTLESVRIDMVENTLLQVLPSHSVVKWNRTTCELWVDIGKGRQAYLKGYSSDAPRKLRGPNFHLAWCDEIATWTDAHLSPQATDTTWSNMALAVRKDDQGSWTPRIIATTTPKAVPLIRNPVHDDPTSPGEGLYDAASTVTSHMTTLENLDNLSSHYHQTVIKPLEGTRLYDQEVLGQLMDAAIGALWSAELVEAMTFDEGWPHAQGGGIQRTIVAVDPSVGAGVGGDECGIVVMGLAADGRAYVLEDASMRGRPEAWCKVVELKYREYGAEAVVVEINQGVKLVEETLGRHTSDLEIVAVWAHKNKTTRAEPTAVLCDADKVRFADCLDADERGKRTAPKFLQLQYQLTTWEGGSPSPDRLDAFVYGCMYLLPRGSGAETMITVIRSGAPRGAVIDDQGRIRKKRKRPRGRTKQLV